MSERWKCEITQVGVVNDDGTLSGFNFDCHGKGTGTEWISETEIYYGGWTADDLRAIIANPASHDLRGSYRPVSD